METENNIGEIFRDAFKDFERKPSDNVWKNIESKAKSPTTKNKFMRNRTNIIVGSAAIVIIAAISYYLLNQTSKDITTNKAVIVNNNSIQAQKIENTTATNIKNTDQTIVNNLTSNTAIQNSVKEINKSTEAIVSPNVQTLNPSLPKQTDIIEKTTIPNTITVPQKSNNNNSNTQKPQQNKNNTITTGSPVDNTPISFTKDQKICKGDKVKLEVTGGSSYLWSTGDRTQYIIVNPAATTDYSVIVTDSKGVIKLGLINVTVGDCEALSVPNAFSPNSTGQAAIFKAYGNNIKSFEMVVFSRSGQIVFSTKNIDDGWNGTLNGGSAAPMGVYVYKINYVDQLNTPHTKSGSVTLIR